jgi:hypothetical protein
LKPGLEPDRGGPTGFGPPRHRGFERSIRGDGDIDAHSAAGGARLAYRARP